jgi:hypothetical protein
VRFFTRPAGRPLNGYFQQSAHNQVMLRAEKNTRAAYINRFAISGNGLPTPIQRFVMHRLLNRETVISAPI